ncbi:GNAT family N-acetyltransferase [Acetobacter sp.]|uniref:GNAT family N-acetyltransferase n=1 Tax=Acetobacter sp. TaxID=440 RepID=UPI0025C27D1D|nr:GNAT family N-acetyltransferase [Acetobacter sp.]MCH4092400.1 N-acetyltransferase [Acetobacter sp.]
MDIHDNQVAHRFEVKLDQVTAWLDYQKSANSLMILHTDVPEALAGRGVGSALVRHAYEVAQAENLTLVSQCSFATAWMKKNVK